jgi:gamma-glutamyltranspeptidase/glutathione hydrolase
MRDLQLPGRSPVLATNGMCATSHPLAAQVALDILKQGGNAMDAALAGGILLGICEPQMTGIGGDCFVLFTPPGSNEVRALNGSGRAPASASAEALRAQGHETVPKTGVNAVTVPGAMDAFCTLSEDHGKIGLDAILAPSIHYATEGVPVAQRVGFDLPAATEKLSGGARGIYAKDGTPFATGDLLRFPGQAEVFKRVAREGRKGFYEGEVAEDMVASLNAAGGAFTPEDFATCRCNYTTPISGEYGGVEVVEHPPNGQGATALLMLNILKHFDIARMDPWGSQRAHIEAEAAKLAYDARNRLIADPDHTARLEHMIAPETAAKLAALIDPQNAMPAAAPLTEEVHRDTIYITVVDRDRMAVSLIYSIFQRFRLGHRFRQVRYPVPEPWCRFHPQGRAPERAWPA